MYYLATPIASTGNIPIDKIRAHRNASISERLEREGYQIFLPQRDVDQSLPGSQILSIELERITNCEGVIAVLSDTRGVYLEAGYAKAIGKRVVALKVKETREMSPWGYAFFDFVAPSIDSLILHLRSLDQPHPTQLPTSDS